MYVYYKVRLYIKRAYNKYLKDFKGQWKVIVPKPTDIIPTSR